jgi:hypothetical protein
MDSSRHSSLGQPSRWSQPTPGADQHEPTDHVGVICRKLLRDAASRRDAEDINGLAKRRSQRLGMLGCQHRHGHPRRKPSPSVEIEHSPSLRPRPKRLLVQPPHRTGPDTGVGRKPCQHDQRRADSRDQARVTPNHTPANVHRDTITRTPRCSLCVRLCDDAAAESGHCDQTSSRAQVDPRCR